MHMLKREQTPTGHVDILSRILDDALHHSRIRCPVCEWQPQPSSLWTCVDNPYPESFLSGCGRSWNTFETFGTCPGCTHQWQWTACLSCGQWSPHEQWYEDEPVET